MGGPVSSVDTGKHLENPLPWNLRRRMNGKRKSGKVEKIRWTARCAPLMRMRSGGTFVFYPRHVDTDPQRDGTHNWPTHICPPCLSITHLPSPRRIYLHPYTPLYPSHFYDFIHLICANNRLTNKNLSPRIAHKFTRLLHFPDEGKLFISNLLRLIGRIV